MRKNMKSREILEKKREDDKWIYNVKWKNFDGSNNTWEPLRNLIHCKTLVRNFERDWAERSNNRISQE